MPPSSSISFSAPSLPIDEALRENSEAFSHKSPCKSADCLQQMAQQEQEQEKAKAPATQQLAKEEPAEPSKKLGEKELRRTQNTPPLSLSFPP